MKLIKVTKKSDSSTYDKVLKQADDFYKIVERNRVWMDVEQLEKLEKKLLRIAQLVRSQANFYKK